MFERFTDRARRVLVLAQEEARNLDHGFIGPEHLFLGLIAAEGIAAKALGELGVGLEPMRDNVAQAIPRVEATGSKLPFTPKAKKALEMSLREALRLGHNYIGTEHILLGVLHVADDDGVIMRSIGVGTDEVRTQVLEILANAPHGHAQRSPALVEALRRAQQLADPEPATTGQMILAILADGACQAAMALERLGLTAESLEAQLVEIPVDITSDALPRPRAVELKLGELTTTIDDPDLAAAIGRLTPDELRIALRDAFVPLATEKRKRRGPGSRS